MPLSDTPEAGLGYLTITDTNHLSSVLNISTKVDLLSVGIKYFEEPASFCEPGIGLLSDTPWYTMSERFEVIHSLSHAPPEVALACSFTVYNT